MHSCHGLHAHIPFVAVIHCVCWMHPLHGLNASIPLVGCIHSIDWLHAFHVLGAFNPLGLIASLPCIGRIHPMCWFHPPHAFGAFIHLFYAFIPLWIDRIRSIGRVYFIALIECIPLMDCIHSFICWMHPFHGLISSRTLHVFQHCVIVQAFAHYCEGVFMHQMARNTRFKKKSLRCNKIKLCAPLPRGRAVRPGLFNYLK